MKFDAKFKHRLIGALVVIAVLAVFLPMIWERGTAIQNEIEVVRIHVEKSLERVEIKPEIKPEIKLEPKPEIKLIPKPAPKPKPKPAQSVKIGWNVQLGTFSDRGNAEKLAKALQKKGYAAYTVMFKSSQNQTLTRVMIGPELTKEAAKNLLGRLETETKLKGLVRRK